MNWLAWLAIGYFFGIATGAAFMYLNHCKAIERYTQKALSEMRDDWHR